MVRQDKTKTLKPVLLGMSWVGVSALVLAAFAGVMYFAEANKVDAERSSSCGYNSDDQEDSPPLVA